VDRDGDGVYSSIVGVYYYHDSYYIYYMYEYRYLRHVLAKTVGDGWPRRENLARDNLAGSRGGVWRRRCIAHLIDELARADGDEWWRRTNAEAGRHGKRGHCENNHKTKWVMFLPESRSGMLKRICGSVDYSTAATVTRKDMFLKSGRQDVNRFFNALVLILMASETRNWVS